MEYFENMGFTRMCVYPKDVQLILGRSERYGRKLLAKIKQELGKQPHQYVSVDEFANHVGLDPDQVRKYLIG